MTDATRDILVGVGAASGAMAAIGLGVLLFCAERAVARRRAELGRYAVSLLGVVASGAYTATCAACAWALLCNAAEGASKETAGEVRTWLWAIFLPAIVFASGAALLAAGTLIRQLLRRLKRTPA